MNRYPSYLEHQGPYNINPTEFRSAGTAAADDPTVYVQTVARLPPLTRSEIEDARAATDRVLHRDGRPPGLTEEETKTFYQYCVEDGIGDRTVRVELPDFRVLTPALVASWQREVLASRPLWRIFIVGETPETVVIIYPEAVRFGDVPPEGGWQSALPRTVAKVLALREAREGPYHRQLEYLRRKLPGALRNLGEEPFRVVAVFDNWKGDSKETTLWITCRGEKKWFDFSMSEPKNAAVAPEFPVRKDGMFGDHYKPEKADFWLKSWVLPAEFRGKITLQKCRPKGVVEGEWSFEFDPAWIIKDADLQARESAPHAERQE